METLINKGDLDDLFRRHLAINSLLQAKLTAFLNYKKYDRTGFNLVPQSPFFLLLVVLLLTHVRSE